MGAVDVEPQPRGAAAEAPVAAEAEAAQCAICTDDVTDRVQLPCQCKVDYCASCWDRALAKSFNSCAQARCPTCRSPIRVDYDHELDQLVFTRQQEEGEAETVDEMRQRLAEQLKPRQILILQEYGRSHPCPAFEAATAGDLEAACGDRGRAAAVDAVSGQTTACASLPPGTTLTTTAASAAEPGNAAVAPKSAADLLAVEHATALAKVGSAPQCVCGLKLELIDASERARRFLKQMEPWRNNRTIAPLLQQGAMHIVCDLCSKPISLQKAAKGIWVCEAGDGTIKHATSNDLCMTCFIRHAWNVENETQIRPPSGPPPAGTTPTAAVAAQQQQQQQQQRQQQQRQQQQQEQQQRQQQEEALE